MTVVSHTLAHQLKALIRPGDTIWWGQATAEPRTLSQAIVAQRHALAGAGRLQVFVGIGCSDSLQPAHGDCIDFLGYGAGGSHRALAEAGLLDVLPCHYAHLPQLIAQRLLPADVVCVQVSPADAQGRHSLGMAQEYLPAAIGAARVVLGEVHADVPWTHGGNSLLASDFDLLIEGAQGPLEMLATPAGPVEQAIAAHIAQRIEDGSCLQVGIGKLPEAVLASLHQHRDLGLHSGAIGDAVVALAQAGVLTHAQKTIDKGIGVAGVLMGSARLRHWAHLNPQLQLRETSYTHHPQVLASLDRLVAINSAVEVDMTGQINAEVAGGAYVGAVGGAMDFLRGAAMSRAGLPIVALPATAGPHSRIVASLSGPVSTPRADAGLVVTEYGVADLRGQPLSRRLRRMLDIAAPAHREALERQAHAVLRQQGAALGR